MPSRNIVLVVSHDTGKCISPYGYPIDTPALARFAREGLLFRNAFCANPTCSPSRAALMTGQCAHSAGMFGLVNRGFSLARPQEHLAHILGACGWQTALCGIQHEAREPASLGYRHVRAAGSRSTEVISGAAASLVRALEEPFFLSIGFFDTHRPFPDVHGPGGPQVGRALGPLPDCAAARADTAGFHAGVQRLDKGIGRILDAIDEAGLRERTMVAVTTDHGPAFPGMKCCLSDGGIGVMLTVRGPGIIPGRVCDALVSHTDFVPTACDWLGVPMPSAVQGRSLVPGFDGSLEGSDAIYSEVNFHAAYEPQRCIRTRRFKYIRRFGDRTRPVLANIDQSPTKAAWLGLQLHENVLASEECYDLEADPAETRNLAGDESATQTVAHLRQRLHEWMRRTCDPLRNGRLSPPEGAELNDPDAMSPDDPTYLAGWEPGKRELT